MRPTLLNPLFASVATLPGIARKTERLYARLVGRPDGARVLDLVFHVPSGAVDRRLQLKLRDVVPGSTVTVAVAAEGYRAPSPNRPRAPFQVYTADDTGTLTIAYFALRKEQIERMLPLRELRYVSGTVESYDGMLQMVHPERVVDAEQFASMALVEPLYPLTEGLTQNTLRRAIAAALATVPVLPEWLDPAHAAREQWPDFAAALTALHRPAAPPDLTPDGKAWSRLAYDEMLASQLALALIRAHLRRPAGRRSAAQPVQGRQRLGQDPTPALPAGGEGAAAAAEIPPRLRGGWPREARPGGAPSTDLPGSATQAPYRAEDPTPTLPEDGEGDAGVSIAGMDEPRRAEFPHGDLAQAEAWIDALIAGRLDDTIWLTGEGLRRLIGIAERTGRRAAFTAALGRVRLITRGPKPARVLRELGFAPGVAAATPTSQGVIEALAGENLQGRRIGVQLYPGDGALPLLAALRERGAKVFPVTPYRYAEQADDAQVVDAIRALADGRIGMVAFTSSPQVERLFDVARAAGLEPQLTEAFRHIRVAAIGPVVEETLRAHGITEVLRPESSFHLKPLVRAIAAGWGGSGDARH
jgi:uroporphyrinogen-III synthase